MLWLEHRKGKGNRMERKVFAKSVNRYRASATERRLYGGSTVTEFIVGFEGSEPAMWAKIMGYGPTPGERKTYAIDKYLAQNATNP